MKLAEALIGYQLLPAPGPLAVIRAYLATKPDVGQLHTWLMNLYPLDHAWDEVFGLLELVGHPERFFYIDGRHHSRVMGYSVSAMHISVEDVSPEVYERFPSYEDGRQSGVLVSQSTRPYDLWLRVRLNQSIDRTLAQQVRKEFNL
jgi:hypothetical protein